MEVGQLFGEGGQAGRDGVSQMGMKADQAGTDVSQTGTVGEWAGMEISYWGWWSESRGRRLVKREKDSQQGTEREEWSQYKGGSRWLEVEKRKVEVRKLSDDRGLGSSP